jgi:hypothetical protein
MLVRLAYRLQTIDSESTKNVHDLTPHIRNRESSQWALRVRQPCQYHVDPAAALRPVCERPTVDGKSRERGVQVEPLERVQNERLRVLSPRSPTAVLAHKHC